jgi:hypothetical protein
MSLQPNRDQIVLAQKDLGLSDTMLRLRIAAKGVNADQGSAAEALAAGNRGTRDSGKLVHCFPADKLLYMPITVNVTQSSWRLWILTTGPRSLDPDDRDLHNRNRVSTPPYPNVCIKGSCVEDAKACFCAKFREETVQLIDLVQSAFHMCHDQHKTRHTCNPTVRAPYWQPVQ